MKVEKQFKRTVKAGLILFAAGLLLGAVIVYAVTPSSTFYIGNGIYPGAPSFTIWTEDSNYFAKDANGELKYSGTNASLIIQNALDAMGQHGILFLRDGVYLITSRIYMSGNNIWLRGESWKTILRRETEFGNHLITTDLTDWQHDIHISDLTIEDILTNSELVSSVYMEKLQNVIVERLNITNPRCHGIELNDVKNARVSDCIVTGSGANYASYQIDGTNDDDRSEHQVWERLVSVNSGGSGIDFHNYGHHDIVARDCVIISPSAEGFRSQSTIGEYTDISIIDNWIYNASKGISLKDLKSGKINGNHIFNTSSIGIEVLGVNYDTDPAKDFTIIANDIRDCAGTGIAITYSKNFRVAENHVENCSGKQIGILGCYNGTVSENILITPATQIGIRLYEGTDQCKGIILLGNIIRGASIGIQESHTSDYNVIVSCDTRTCTTGITTVGANTKVNLSWNASSWIS